MMRASSEFNLTLRDFQEEETALGVWNGDKFQFTVGLFGFQLCTEANNSIPTVRRIIFGHRADALEVWVLLPEAV